MKNKVIFCAFLSFLTLKSLAQSMTYDATTGSDKLEISNNKADQINLNSTNIYGGGGVSVNINNIQQGYFGTGFFLVPGISIAAMGQRNITMQTNSQPRFFIKSTGAIGVGTLNPDPNYLMDINGKLKTSDVLINGGLQVNNVKLFGVAGQGVRNLYVNNLGEINADKRIHYKSITYADFTSDGGQHYISPVVGMVGAYNGISYLVTGIDLPNGAIVTGFKYYCTDNDSDKNMRLEFRITPLTSPNSIAFTDDTIGETNFNYIREFIKNFTSPVTIDNSNNMYTIRMVGVDNSGTTTGLHYQYLRAVVISYLY
jgi:hypothetical protein